MDLEVTNPPSGADENFVYQWQESSDKITYTNIEDEQGSEYQPGILDQSTYFRVSTISEFGCLPTYSNEVLIKVFGPFDGGVISSGSNVCFLAEPALISFATNPSGGSEAYNYNWQKSEPGGLWEAVGSDSEIHQPESSTSDTYFRVIVNDKKGCGTDTSNNFFLHVYEAFRPGSIASNDSLCTGSVASKILSTSAPGGGDGTYSYKWELSNDLVTWQEISGATNETLEPGLLQDTRHYRRTDISGSGCGEKHTGSVVRFIHPLPEGVTPSGKSEVCRNESDLLYSFEENQESISHSWKISGGEILSHPQASTIKINWDTQKDASLVLIRVNDSTGCIKETDFGIQKKILASPDKSEIVRKFESDMLILMDTTPGVKHIWWYSEKEGDDSIMIQENEKRYCALPHSFDSTLYTYWISTAFIEDQGWECITNSYLGPSLISMIPESRRLSDIKIYPNPTVDHLYIAPVTSINTPVLCRIFDIHGRSVFESRIQNPTEIYHMDLSKHDLSPGLYMVTLYTIYGTLTQSLVIH